MDLREIECKAMDWIHLAQNKDQRWALGNTAINLTVPQKAGHLTS
jgi:hypothetical protein